MRFTAIAAAVAAVLGFVAVYATLAMRGNGEVDSNVTFEEKSKKITGERLRGFIFHKQPKDAAEMQSFEFQDRFGNTKTLADWRGKVVLVNLWATWCGPCREEMPSLDNLKKTFDGQEFDVVAISMDRGGLKKPKDFYEETEIKNLALYIDPTTKLMFRSKAVGLPATILFDRQGREIGRLPGPAHWDSDEAINLVRGVLAK